MEGWGVKIPRAHFHPRGANFSVPVPWVRCRPGPGVSRVFLVCFSRGRAFRIAAFFVFLLPGAQVSLVRVPQDALSFRSCCPGTYVSHCCVFPFFASRSCVSLCLVAFVLAVPERPFRFFFVHPGECFPFFLSWHPGVCVSRCFFFAAPGRPVSPAPRRVRILFCLAPRRARLALWVFSHFQSCILSLPGQKSILEKHQNTAMRNVRSGMTKSRPRGATNAKPKKAKPPCKDGNEQTSASNTPRFARKKQQMRNAWTKTKTSKTARFETFAQGSRENKQCEKYASR